MQVYALQYHKQSAQVDCLLSPGCYGTCNARVCSVKGGLLEIHPFHPFADTCEDLVGYGTELFCNDVHRQMFAKNLHAVAFVAFDVSDVEHADVHADVSDIRGLLAVYERISSAIAEMTVQSVGIADGNGCNTRGTLHHRTAAISDARTCGNAANLQYGGTQGGDTRQPTVAERVDTVKPQSETTHIELAFGEPLYTCRIADVPEYAIWHGFLQHGRSFVETFELLLREVIKPFIVATHKMRENGTRPQCLLSLQTLDESRHVVFGVESQPAHTGIQFDVYRKFRNAFVACSVHKGIEESETVDFRFQSVLEEGV